MRKIVLAIVLFSAIGFKSNAQGSSDLQLSLNYNIGIPIGEFNEYIGIASFRGMNIQLDYYMSDKLSIGGSIGWNGFYQKKDRESYYRDNVALNGVRYNYLYQLPLYLKVQYILNDERSIMPYIALSAGAHYIEQETYIGYVGIADEFWKFGVAPEVGALALLGQSGWHFKLAAAYHITFYNENNINTLQNLGINLGFNYDF